jgi:hypothetical protein
MNAGMPILLALITFLIVFLGLALRIRNAIVRRARARFIDEIRIQDLNRSRRDLAILRRLRTQLTNCPPFFKGYMVDVKHHQFRRVNATSIEFLDFASPNGEIVMGEYIKALLKEGKSEIDILAIFG